MNIWWEDAFNYEPECCDKYVQHCSWPSPPLGPTPSCFYPLSPVSCYGRTYFLSPEKFLISRKTFMLLKNNFTWSICSLTGSMTVSPDIVIASLWTGGTLGAHWGVGNTSYHAQWAIRAHGLTCLVSLATDEVLILLMWKIELPTFGSKQLSNIKSSRRPCIIHCATRGLLR